LTAAANGLSVDPVSGKVVLGQNVGQAGNPAILLNTRQIPMNNFDLRFEGGHVGVIQGGSNSLASPVGYCLQTVQAGGGITGLFAVQALAATGSGGKLTLYHTRATNAGTLTPLVFGDHLGTITFSGVTAGSTYTESAIIQVVANVVAAGSIDSVFEVFTTIGGAFAVRFRIDGNNTVVLGGTTIDASAKLILDGVTQGFLPNRVTTAQKNAIVAPATGLVVYDTTLNKLALFTGAVWEAVTSV